VWLRGEWAGTAEVFVDPLTGYPDNISLGSDGLIWVAVVSPKTAQLAKVQALPGPVRTLATKVPPRLQPKVDRTVSVVAVDDDGQVVREFCGEIDGFWFLTGVRERDGHLWLGSLEGSSLATVAAG
jgi:hypothetical protein